MKTKCSFVHGVCKFVSFSHCLCVSCDEMPGFSLQRAIIPLSFFHNMPHTVYNQWASWSSSISQTADKYV